MCLNGRILFRLQVRVELNGDIPSPEYVSVPPQPLKLTLFYDENVTS